MQFSANRIFGARLLLSAIICVLMLAPSVAAAAAWPAGVSHVAVPAARQAGSDRYSSAAVAAAGAYPGWAGARHVVVANGEQSALVDSLSAASLCWAYDAPLLLTSAHATPGDTRAALQAIVSANTTVTVHVVGGSTVVPRARIAELKALVGPKGTVEQPWRSGNRYTTAAGIAARVRQVAKDTSRTIPPAAFLVNGAEEKRFTDALAASAVSRASGIPVLLTASTSAPWPTVAALTAAGNPEVVVVGGTQAVSTRVSAAVGGDVRWWGQTKIGTAVAVARGGVARGWTSGSRVGLASSVVDALAGASAIGRSGGLIIPTEHARMPREVFDYLVAPAAPVSKAVVFGGQRAIADGQLAEVQGAPGTPLVTDPATKWVGKTMRVRGVANANATQVALYINGALEATRAIVPYGAFDFGTYPTPSKRGTLEVRASNPDGKTGTFATPIERLAFPAATCIIIDKSEFKLYWIKNNALVKVYPIAIGRGGMETPVRTWKILAKYKTDPSSVYGPRKMRLFQKSGSSWAFTAYAIHGTNQPWVIGTKASHGCIRMYNRDVLELFPQVPMGTLVMTRD